MSNAPKLHLAARVYDPQAAAFDHERGLARCAPAIVAQGLLAMWSGERHSARVLELGAGTGELGLGIAAQVERYAAIEASPEMAKLWRQRFAAARVGPERGILHQQDADREWPVGDAAVDLVFASRAAHWLDSEHVLKEFARTSRPHAALILGRVVRDPTHPQRRLRSWMHEELRSLGYLPKDGPRQGHELLRRLVESDPAAAWLPERWLISWPHEARVASILERWRRKPGLAGVELPDAERQALLDRIAVRAKAELGPLDSGLCCQEGYALQGVALNADTARSHRIPPRTNAASAAPTTDAATDNLTSPCVRLTSRFGSPIHPQPA